MRIFEDIYKIFTLLLVIILDLNGDGTTEKEKQQVVDDALAQIDKPGGIDVPSWLRSILPMILPILVSFVVKKVQESDFFEGLNKK